MANIGTRAIKTSGLRQSHYCANPNLKRKIYSSVKSQSPKSLFSSNPNKKSEVKDFHFAHPQQTSSFDMKNLEEFCKSKLAKDTIPYLSTTASMIGNAASATANLLNMPAPIRKAADFLGAASNKIFFLYNSFINTLEQVRNKNFTSALGYGVAIVDPAIPQRLSFLFRGLTTGFTQLSNVVNMLTGRSKFKDFADHMDNLKTGLRKGFKAIANTRVHNIFDSKNPALGLIGSLMALVGVGNWFTTGNVNSSTAVRDSGGILIDLEQAKFSNLKEGKKNWFMSGVTYLFGSIFDIAAKFISEDSGLVKRVPFLRKAFESLCFFGDNLGRHFLRLAQNSGELTEDSKEKESEEFANKAEKTTNILHFPAEPDVALAA